MNPIALFTSFSGRINRAKWWLSAIALLLISSAVQYVIDPSLYHGTDPLKPISLPVLLANLIVYVLGFALIVKRMNDRNWSSPVKVLCGLIGFGTLFATYYMMNNVVDLSPVDAANPAALFERLAPLWPIIVVQWALVLFLLIDNGMLKGTVGPNQYGEDPIAHKHTDVA